MRRAPFTLLLLPFLLVACGDGPTDPPPGGDAVALVIAPGALVLPAEGATHQLRALAVNENGDSTEVNASFESSAPAVVAVSSGGLATGGSSVGSALIVARSGALTSAPMLALRATPASGALLVSDDEVVGAVEAVDRSVPQGLGRQFRARFRGPVPAVGQFVIGTGAAPVGGRVVSVSGGAGDAEVVFELVPLSVLFDAISINARIPLIGAVESAEPSSLRGGPSRNLGQVDVEFERGPFKCKLEVPAPIAVPISLGTFSGDLNESLALDLVVEFGVVRRLVVEGTIRPTVTVTPRITAALEGKAECKWQIREFPLPVTGLLQLFFGGQVPLGVGFEVGAKTTIGQLGADITLQSTINAKVGFDCTGECQPVHELAAAAPSLTVTPVIPDLATSPRLELGVSAFGWAELQIGVPLWSSELTRVKLLGAKLGVEQKFELASEDAQAADAAYASSYALKPVLEVKAGAEYEPLEDLLQVTLTAFTYAPELPVLSRSPRGTFAITPASVRAGDDTELGERATFTVTLTDTDYFGAYAVESVLLRWRRNVGETVVLESGRPGCSELTASTGQLSFTCETDFLTEHIGMQTFHAFVRSRIWGVPVTIPLEIAPDAKAVVTVSEGGVGSVTLLDVDGAIFTETDSEDPGVCGEEFTPDVVPLVSEVVRCTSNDAEAQAQWTASWSTMEGGITEYVAELPVLVVAGAGSYALAAGTLGIDFDVAGTGLRYELTGEVTVLGTSGEDWGEIETTVKLEPPDPLPDFEVESSNGSVPINESGSLSPGRYQLDITARLEAFKTGGELRQGNSVARVRLRILPE